MLEIMRHYPDPKLLVADQESAQAPPRAQTQSSTTSLSHSNDADVHPMTAMTKVTTDNNDIVDGPNDKRGMINAVHREHQKKQTHHNMKSEEIGWNGMHMMNGNGVHQGHQTSDAHMNGNDERIVDVSIPNQSNRKLIKIRLNPGEKSAKPLMVTVSIDAPTTYGLEELHDLSLGVGQKVQLQHYEKRGVKSLEISFQPSPRDDSIPWEPPLVLSEEDVGRPGVDAIKPQVQSLPQDQSVDKSFPVIDAKGNGAALKDDTVSEQISPTAATSRFDNATTETSEVVVPQAATFDTMPPPVKSLHPFVFPSILTPTVDKLTPTEKVGLAFRKANNVVVIEKVVPGSPADGKALYPGYECLSINGHRVRSARRAAELVRECEKSLTLVVSNAPRPPGTFYTMISVKNQLEPGRDFAQGMHFKSKHGLVKLINIDANSPISVTSMKVGDFILAIDGTVISSVPKAVEAIAKFNKDSMVPLLYFSLQQLYVSLVEKVIGDLWKKEWSNGYKECVVLQPGHNSLIPWTLRFKEDGTCTLLDPLRAFRRSSAGNSTASVPPALHSVVETINHGVASVMSALREGVAVAASEEKVKAGLIGENSEAVS